MEIVAIMVNSGLLLTFIALILIVYLTVRYRKGGLRETKVVASYSKSGSISWDAYFRPKTQEDLEKRLPATIAIAVFFTIGVMITAIMKLMDF